MNVSHQVSVLAVDDDPAFVKLTARLLETRNERLEVHTETTASTALESFPDHDIDCIVSDFDMPGMDGIEFLEGVRRIDRDVPFILFTGKGSEEVASDAISAGVTDYLQKQAGTDQFTLLANKILNGVARYRAELERRLTIDRVTDAIIEVDDDWQITTINGTAEGIYGKTAEELRGRNLWELFPEAVETPFYDAYQEVMETGDPTTLEEYYEPFQAWFEVHVYPGLYGGLSIYFRDVTERRGDDELRR